MFLTCFLCQWQKSRGIKFFIPKMWLSHGFLVLIYLSSFGRKQLSYSVACGVFPDKGWSLSLLQGQEHSLPLSLQKSPGFLSFFLFLSLLVLISVQCYFTVVLISNFLMIYDFWVFLIYLFTICMFSLARCSDLSILNEVVCSRFFGIVWVQPFIRYVFCKCISLFEACV